MFEYVKEKAVDDGFRSSWGGSSSSYTRRVSIYGTYTPSQ